MVASTRLPAASRPRQGNPRTHELNRKKFRRTGECGRHRQCRSEPGMRLAARGRATFPKGSVLGFAAIGPNELSTKPAPQNSATLWQTQKRFTIAASRAKKSEPDWH